MILWILALPVSSDPSSFPTPVGAVNDFAGILDASSKSELSEAILEFQRKTTVEIAVVTVQTIAPYGSIEEYANELFRTWKIGKAKENNGLLIVAALKEKKVRIEVGYGLEEIIPDGLAGEVIRTRILPSFKEGRYSEGLKRGISSLIQIIAQKKGIELPAREKGAGTSWRDSSLFFDSVVFILILIFLASRIFFNPMQTRYRDRFWRNGGGGFGGGFGGFGGSGGGGFGGFGGGDSGGGGASGNWVII